MLANLKLTKQRARLNSWVGGRHPIRLACIVLCSLLALFLSRNTIQADVAPASSEKGRGIELNLLPEGLDGIAVEIEPPAAATEPSKTRTKDPRLSGRTETTTSSVTTENTITNKLPPLTTTAKVLSSALVTDNLVRVVATTKKPVVQGPAAAPTYEASTPSGGYQFSGRATWYNPCDPKQNHGYRCVGTCDNYLDDSSVVVALNVQQYQSGMCRKQCVEIYDVEKRISRRFTVADSCAACGYGGIDLTPASLAAFGRTTVGWEDAEFPIQWKFC